MKELFLCQQLQSHEARFSVFNKETSSSGRFRHRPRDCGQKTADRYRRMWMGSFKDSLFFVLGPKEDTEVHLF